ncbi:uncharacterized protein PHACADRAFT_246140 [Phanerochaete carnosa HHB-10118-sp]|uniref:Uncharacterized protein n=1 Tax=Phanerochaete carnosa (strain HHB-10118-sp) TaxID=650164 RepID=K5W8J5_PHACS|nr:uncharacterized protein PHACADRAFT_246140 [Phanerochaete carnosa HHB-10118-sp]EKM60268.1 hypothetical protein PHACADRAFT_246140 [Phanerochaete carnosa HHB-10118-sp]
MQVWAAHSPVRSLYISGCKSSSYLTGYPRNLVDHFHTASVNIQRLAGSMRTLRLLTTGRVITTVNPAKLTGDCFRDFSGLKLASLRFQDVGSSSRTWRRTRGYLGHIKNGPNGYIPFPPRTHGFLYYHPPPPWAHDLAGEIRFRITKDSDPSSFASGHDLLAQGMPWSVTLLFNAPISASFRNVLLRDGLLSEDQTRRMERMEPWRSKITAKSRLIHSIGQPFALPLGTNRNAWMTTRYIVPGIIDGRDVLKSFDVASGAGSLWGYDAGPDETRVLKDAIAIVHFEPWVHPRYKKRRCVALRIRRLLNYDGLPGNLLDDHPGHGAAGHLLHSLGPVRGKVWYHDLDQGSVAWRYLRLPPEGGTTGL